MLYCPYTIDKIIIVKGAVNMDKIKRNWVITKWCKIITDSGKDEYKDNSHVENLAQLTNKFRLLDDDGNVYAYGLSKSDSSFAPLDAYQNDYGCVWIEYKNPTTNKYEVL